MTRSFPPGWTKTVADLAAEIPGRYPTSDEWAWARAYERSELSKWARFPKDGEVYEAINDTPVEYLTHWHAPVTDGGNGVIPGGTRIRVSVLREDPAPIGVYADPVDHERVEQLLVPEAVRLQEKYNGFSLSITTTELNRLFRRVG